MTEQKKYKHLKHFNTPGHAHELTYSCYHSSPYLSDPQACKIFLSELEQARTDHEFALWAYVLMPTHVHLLIWPQQNNHDIAQILNDVNGRMVKRYRDFIIENNKEKFEKFQVFDKSKKRNVFRFWQAGGGFDRNIWNGNAISIDYIEANPVRRNLARKPSEYPWSSAYAREQNSGLVPDVFNIPVAMLNPQIQRIGAILVDEFKDFTYFAQWGARPKGTCHIIKTDGIHNTVWFKQCSQFFTLL